jgi:hypothetical protein
LKLKNVFYDAKIGDCKIRPNKKIFLCTFIARTVFRSRLVTGILAQVEPAGLSIRSRKGISEEKTYLLEIQDKGDLIL